MDPIKCRDSIEYVYEHLTVTEHLCQMLSLMHDGDVEVSYNVMADTFHVIRERIDQDCSLLDKLITEFYTGKTAANG